MSLFSITLQLSHIHFLSILSSIFSLAGQRVTADYNVILLPLSYSPSTVFKGKTGGQEEQCEFVVRDREALVEES